MTEAKKKKSSAKRPLSPDSGPVSKRPKPETSDVLCSLAAIEDSHPNEVNNGGNEARSAGTTDDAVSVDSSSPTLPSASERNIRSEEDLPRDNGSSSTEKDEGESQEIKKSSTDSPMTSSPLPSVPPPNSTFASVFRPKPMSDEEKKGQQGPFLEDFDVVRVIDLPAQCEVTEDRLQDPALAEDYEALPNLRAGSLRSWKASAVGQGHPSFSQYWSSTIPDMRLWNCMHAVKFDHHERYVNPSRASPLLVNAKRMTQDGRNLRLCVAKTHAVCVTCVSVTESYLLHVPSVGLPQKQLRGVVHSQEWERLEAFFCMVFRQPVLSAQLYKDALSFTTKTGENRQSGMNMFKRSEHSKTEISHANAVSSRPEPFLLDCNDEVPVYDARSSDINLTTDIAGFKHTLPRFEGEIPKNSFVVVAYSANSYHSAKTSSWNLSLNILWAIVMGTPSVE